MEKDDSHISYTEEELKNIFGFISALRKIHDRLITEGVNIETLWLEWQEIMNSDNIEP